MVHVPLKTHTPRTYILGCLLLVFGTSGQLAAQDTNTIRPDTLKHKHKLTQVYCKIKTIKGDLQNETFHIYMRDKIIYEITLNDHATEYYFPIEIESWSHLDEMYTYLDDNKSIKYHFKKRKRSDGVYEYDLVLDLSKFKRRNKRSHH
ncbi:MAG TPA: hypothetical protein VL947_07620 [Cytophagales bacterium]|nr:hypothetical protein [Cytophagales bacterium]